MYLLLKYVKKPNLSSLKAKSWKACKETFESCLTVNLTSIKQGVRAWLQNQTPSFMSKLNICQKN